MSQADLKNKINSSRDSLYAEPLLPIEQKLIVGSLGIGIVLLVVLTAVNHFFPIQI